MWTDTHTHTTNPDSTRWLPSGNLPGQMQTCHPLHSAPGLGERQPSGGSGGGLGPVPLQRVARQEAPEDVHPEPSTTYSRSQVAAPTTSKVRAPDLRPHQVACRCRRRDSAFRGRGGVGGHRPARTGRQAAERPLHPPPTHPRSPPGSSSLRIPLVTPPRVPRSSRPSVHPSAEAGTRRRRRGTERRAGRGVEWGGVMEGRGGGAGGCVAAAAVDLV